MGPGVKSDGEPTPGDTVHVVGHGPATLVEIRGGRQQQQSYLVLYPDGTKNLASREEILVHEASGSSPPTGSPRGPRPLVYLGRPFSDPGRSIRTPSATFSLVATMVGGGVLSLPYAMSQSGIAFGTLALLLSGLASGWTIELLVECARSTGRDTFELVGHAAFGEVGRKGTLSIVFIICWLSMIAYFVLIGDMLQPTAELVVPALKDVGSSETVRRLVLGVAAVALSPMCFKSNLAALRFMCFASVGSVLLVSCMVTLRAAESLGEAHDVEVVLEDGSYRTILIPADFTFFPKDWWRALYVFPMFGVSFLCHFNALPTHYELQRPTQYRMRRIVVLTMGFTSILYLCVGIFGYLFGGRCTCGNILLNFSPSDKLVAVGRVALGLVLMLNFPLICQPCRNALFRVLLAQPCCSGAPRAAGPAVPQEPSCHDTWVLTAEATGQDQSDRSFAQLTSPLRSMSAAVPLEERVEGPISPPRSPQQSSNARVHVYRREDALGSMSQGAVLEAFDSFAPKDETVQQSSAEPTQLQLIALTVALLLSSLLVSYFMRSILVVWSILGSTVAFLVSFILPALFWYRIVGRASTTRPAKRWAALALLGMCVVLAIACTVLTCLNLGAPRCPTTTAAGAVS